MLIHSHTIIFAYSHIIDATIAAQKFGVASSSNEISTGIMGVGPGIEFTGYPIILDSLASQGFINSRAFSLDLRSVDSPSGETLPYSMQSFLN